MNDTILPNANNARPTAKNKGIANEAKSIAVVATNANAAASAKVASAACNTCSGGVPIPIIILVIKIPASAKETTIGTAKATPSKAAANTGPNGVATIKMLAITANSMAAKPIVATATAITNTAVQAMIVLTGS